MQKYVIAVALLVLTILTIFWRVNTYEFSVYDDPHFVLTNKDVHKGLSFDGIVSAFTSRNVANLIPLTWISYAFDYERYKLEPGGYHRTNLLLHCLNVVLVFFMIDALTGLALPAFFVALFFGIHPLHVESVAWIAERKGVLSTVFWCLCLLTYTRYTRSGSPRMFVAGLIFYALGYLAKPMVITLPFLMLLLDFWPLNRFGDTKPWSKPGLKRVIELIAEKLPYFTGALFMAIVIVLYQRRAGAIPSLDAYPFGLRVENALMAYTEYLKQTFWPAKLAVHYPYPLKSAPLWTLARSVIVLAGISAVCLWQATKRPYLIVGWLWFVGMLIPVIGLVQVGGQAHADRYTYLPLIGIFVMVVWSVYDAAKAANKNYLVPSVVLAAAAGALMAPAWIQTGHWRTGVSLFEHALAVTENNALAHSNLGAALIDRDDDEEARPHLIAALEIDPGRVPARINLGLLLIKDKLYDQAMEQFIIALSIEPKNAMIFNSMGVTRLEQDRAQEAISFLHKAVAIEPDYMDARSNLGNALLRLGRPEEAIAYYAEVLEAEPEHPDVLTNLGGAYVAIEAYEEALAPLERALARGDGNEATHLNLAIALFQLGREEDSIRHIYHSLRLNPDYVNARKFLAYIDEEKKRMKTERF